MKLRTLLLTLFGGILLAAGATYYASASAQDVRYYEAIPNEEGLWHQESWEVGDNATVLVVNFPQDGYLEIVDAYVFTATISGTIKINGVNVPVFEIPGELAPHFTYTQMVAAGEDMTIEIAPNPPGSELGFWYKYTEPPTTECETATLSTDGGLLQFDWNQPQDALCAKVSSTVTGVLDVTGGWVFNPPISMNGVDLGTHIDPDELAPQLDPFTYTIAAGETITFETSWADGGSQLGVFYELEEYVPPKPVTPTVMIFLPVVERAYIPPATLYFTETMNLVANKLQVKSHGWLNAVSNQQVCLVIDFSGSTDALLESGWTFGQEVHAYVDGLEYPIDYTPGANGEAGQIGNLEMALPETITICSKNENATNEIGLRIRFPGN